MVKSNTIIVEKSSGSGGAILTIGLLGVGAYVLFKAMPYLIGAEVAKIGVEGAVAATKKDIAKAETVGKDRPIPTELQPAFNGATSYTKVYDYKHNYENLPPIQKAAVTVGSGAGGLVGYNPITHGADLRLQFEEKLSANRDTQRFNELDPNARMFIRFGEGISNLFGFSPYSSGVATKKFLAGK